MKCVYLLILSVCIVWIVFHEWETLPVLVMWFSKNHNDSSLLLRGADEQIDPLKELPPVLHFVWYANPLRAYALLALDAASRYIPRAVVKLHIVTPQGCSPTTIRKIEDRVAKQLVPLKLARESALELVIHHDFIKEAVGTPFENLGIEHYMVGGSMSYLLAPQKDPKNLDSRGGHGTPFGPNRRSMTVASNIWRYLVLYKEGGLYLDLDYIVMSDVLSVAQSLGSFLSCEQIKKTVETGVCTVNGVPFGVTARHPFVLHTMEVVANRIRSSGVERFFPQTPEMQNALIWGISGPRAISASMDFWIKNKSDVWILLEHPPNLKRTFLVRPSTYPESRNHDTIVSNRSIALVMNREIYNPTLWMDKTYLKNTSSPEMALFDGALGFHMWEFVEFRKDKLLTFLRNPKYVISELFRRSCFVFCDVELMQSMETIGELV